jgi:hypothetical protein
VWYWYRNKRVPDLEDLLKQVEMDELMDRAANSESDAGGDLEEGEDQQGEKEEGHEGMDDSLMDELLAEEAAREAAEDEEY